MSDVVFAIYSHDVMTFACVCFLVFGYTGVGAVAIFGFLYTVCRNGSELCLFQFCPRPCEEVSSWISIFSYGGVAPIALGFLPVQHSPLDISCSQTSCPCPAKLLIPSSIIYLDSDLDYQPD